MRMIFAVTPVVMVAVAVAMVVVVGWFCSGILPVAGLDGMGTVTLYKPPSRLTKCGVPIPGNGIYAAASKGIFAGGAACGENYLFNCLSGPNNPCKNETGLVPIVDECPTDPCPATFVLSEKAIGTISKSINAKINVEFKQL